MRWTLSHRCDPRARPIADRHYNRQHIGAANFVPPGRCVVLLADDESALWVSSWPYAQYVKHAWAGAWVCSLFRNEGHTLSSALIREALAATRWVWGDPPALGMITFVDTKHTKPKRDPGYCYIKAGFAPVGMTKVNKLVALQIAPDGIPEAAPPLGAQLSLMEVA